jgi:chemosensory pili system protein ChpC
MPTTPDELFCLLIALDGDRLLLPRSGVAEVMAWTEPAAMAGAPAWYLGTVSWNGQTVPVLSFEVASGRAAAAPSGRTRIVLVHALGERIPSRIFGIVTQGFPQTVRVTREVLKADPTRHFAEAGPALCQVRIINEVPLIPDLEWLESMIADETVVGTG